MQTDYQKEYMFFIAETNIKGELKVLIQYTVYSTVLKVFLRYRYLFSLTFKLSCLTL